MGKLSHPGIGIGASPRPLGTRKMPHNTTAVSSGTPIASANFINQESLLLNPYYQSTQGTQFYVKRTPIFAVWIDIGMHLVG